MFEKRSYTCIIERIVEEEIYKQNILDHYKHPHNKYAPSLCSVQQDGKNASCGDSLTIYLNIEDGDVAEAFFEGDGCAISQAAASMLTDKVKGMSVENVKLLTQEDMYTMLGIAISSGRTKCALLAYETLGMAIKNYEETKQNV